MSTGNVFFVLAVNIIRVANFVAQSVGQYVGKLIHYRLGAFPYSKSTSHTTFILSLTYPHPTQHHIHIT